MKRRNPTEAQPKRRIEKKITKQTKAEWSFGKNAEFSGIAVQSNRQTGLAERMPRPHRSL
jgi:hypothetical protein